MYPPLHPLHEESQSTSSCSERLKSVPVLILFIPSIAPVAEKDQQLPIIIALAIVVIHY